MYPNPARNTNPRFFIFAQIFFSGKGLYKHVLPASCPRALGPGGLPDLPVHPVRRQKSQMAGNHERGLPRKKNLVVFHSDFFSGHPPFVLTCHLGFLAPDWVGRGPAVVSIRTRCPNVHFLIMHTDFTQASQGQ